MNIRIFIFFVFSLLGICAFAQKNKLIFDGQLSATGNYNFDNDFYSLLAGRYIPELSYTMPIDSTKNLSFFASANIFGSSSFVKDEDVAFDGSINPYRIWVRFSDEQYEIRLGLQKIDFGSASILRPLQWFNEIDPRDPLQLTNGVYGALGRYYFPNNANIWIWGLYGNDETRGTDLIGSYKYSPEFGARVQLPVPKGEIAFSYHHRNADASKILQDDAFQKIPENRYGIDAKWDVGVGLWVEASHVHKTKNIEQFSNQTLATIGTDYTFGIGSGLNVVLEHMVSSYDKDAFAFTNTNNISATTISYPIGFFDNISTILYYDWNAENFTFFMNYEHQFKHITGYIMAYYNPKTQTTAQAENNDFINAFSGPGIRLMVVYNH